MKTLSEPISYLEEVSTAFKHSVVYSHPSIDYLIISFPINLVDL